MRLQERKQTVIKSVHLFVLLYFYHVRNFVSFSEREISSQKLL